jgi:hypothetical protein
MIVTFIDTAVAPPGIVQFPFVPVTCATKVSPAPTGVALVPTLSGAGRVSANRHGVIGTNDDAAPAPDADDVNTPPAPTHTTNAAPNAAQRERTNSKRLTSDPLQHRPSPLMTHHDAI